MNMEHRSALSDLVRMLRHLVDTADMAESVIAEYIDSSTACPWGIQVRAAVSQSAKLGQC